MAVAGIERGGQVGLGDDDALGLHKGYRTTTILRQLVDLVLMFRRLPLPTRLQCPIVCKSRFLSRAGQGWAR